MSSTNNSGSLVYASPNGVDISLDYTIPADATAENPAPVLIWFHGGGLIQGNRKDVPPHLRLTSSLTRTHPPYGFISLDYRLAPQTRLPSILADTLSAISFITSPSSAFAKAIEGRLDTSRLVVSGSSAGGWLALMVGTGAGFKECGLQEPFGRESGRGKLLKGVVGIYPITGLEDPFWTEKKRPVGFSSKIIDKEDMAPFLDPNGQEISFNEPNSPRQSFYQYMVQEGILSPLLLSPSEPAPSAFNVATHISSSSPTSLAPIYLVHGTVDTYVPVQQSYDVRDALDKAGMEVEMEVVEGKEHGYDYKEGVAMEGMWGFVERCLGGSVAGGRGQEEGKERSKI